MKKQSKKSQIIGTQTFKRGDIDPDHAKARTVVWVMVSLSFFVNLAVFIAAFSK